MTTTVTGFDGTIDESTFARGQAIANRRGVVASRSSFNAFQVANARAVRLTGGTAMDAGVLLEVTDATATTQAIPGPQAGQWFLIVIRRDWDKNTVTYAVLGHDATSTATPTSPPTGTPSEFADQPGVMADQRLWWVWAVTGSTNVLLVDARRMPAALEKSGTTAERATYYGPTPTTIVGRRALQGSRWFNTTTNLDEVYMADYNATTNPGGLASPGWYSIGNNGDPVVAKSAFPAYLDTPPGKDSLVDYLDFNLTQGRFIDVEHYMSWYAPGNAAGTLFAALDSLLSANAIKKQRIHSQGGPVKFGPVWLRYKMWMPAGSHRINVVFSAETASTPNGKIETSSTATGAQ